MTMLSVNTEKIEKKVYFHYKIKPDPIYICHRTKGDKTIVKILVHFCCIFLICFKWSNIILSITLTHLSVSNRSLVTSLWPRSYHLQMEKFHDPIYLYVHGMNFDVVRVWNSYPQLEVSYNV